MRYELKVAHCESKEVCTFVAKNLDELYKIIRNLKKSMDVKNKENTELISKGLVIQVHTFRDKEDDSN